MTLTYRDDGSVWHDDVKLWEPSDGPPDAVTLILMAFAEDGERVS